MSIVYKFLRDMVRVWFTLLSVLIYSLEITTVKPDNLKLMGPM